MKILVIGGYGTFGKRIVSSLLNYYEHEVVVAGRSKEKLAKAKHMLKVSFAKNIETVEIDVSAPRLVETLKVVNPHLVINASGPYQLQNELGCEYLVAEACLDVGCHYVDLADDRQYVSEFTVKLDVKAKKKGLVLVTGASTVPSVADAVIAHYLPEFKNIDSVNYGISPGNRTDRGRGTVASILSYAGKPFNTLSEGDTKRVFGWQDLDRYDFGKPIGKRWMSNCEIPDLDVLPALYPQVRNIRFQAGLEVSVLHIGLWILSWFPRIGLVSSLRKFTDSLIAMSDWFKNWGSDCGGMFIELEGIDHQDNKKKVVWHLVAEEGVGPNVPTIAAELVLNKINDGELEAGAYPCTGLFSLEAFLIIAARWGIYQREIKQ